MLFKTFLNAMDTKFSKTHFKLSIVGTVSESVELSVLGDVTEACTKSMGTPRNSHKCGGETSYANIFTCTILINIGTK